MARRPTRRETIQYLSVGIGSAALAGCGGSAGSSLADAGGSPDAMARADAGACGVATGAQTAGPFYPGEPPTRMNIVGDRTGVALALDLVVVRADTCAPVTDAEVDVWSADASGDYSGYATFGTVGQDWLRGQQLTDGEGKVMVDTIMPGSYPGRAVHIHVKVRAAGLPELTTQMYFPDPTVAEVLATAGYDGAPQTSNAIDGFYSGDTLLEVSGTPLAGYTASGTLIV